MGDYDRAIADYTEAIRLDPKTQHYFNDRAAVYGRQGRHDLAIADLTDAIRLRPDLPFFRHGRGVNYRTLGKNEEALADFAEAVRLMPGYGPYYAERGEMHALLGHADLAKADLAEATKRMDDRKPNRDFFRGYVAAGNGFARLEDYPSAIERYTKALELEPDNAGALASRGNSYRRLGDLDKALADYQQAIELNPESAHAHTSLGNYYLKAGQTANAVQSYSTALSLDSKLPAAMFNRYVANFRLGKLEDLGADGRGFISAKGWREPESNYIAMIEGIVARRATGESASRAALKEALEKCDPKRWPYPITEHLAGPLSEEELLKKATDLEKKTECHLYIGLYRSAEGKYSKAIPHLRWVRDNGEREILEYPAAIVELERLGH
jgi:tetratricopeptide (TPR) repeat protein